ncbi:fumarylacetoacetate hydrolase [Limnohabitans sp. MORI2]|uniref:fumarylacetoacetate hydrolase family protein n=1 Tax=Limnohabitans sp. MORI2 TaxID=1751150 RepID=UPI0023772FF0|nr:fumarylacetoacetate hydrolase family protein [Limnohabitans sp. MORI2]BDU57209.1 fumarylacetoacetate hydrolase [Limnohabitans sp. MORI2]
MKLATYKDGTRDGQLVVVSRDLSTAHYATGIATRMQQALDDWGFIAPQLQDLYETLNNGKARHAFPFDPALCMAPLPRAYQRLTGAAYANHATLLGDAEGGLVVHQASSDHLLGAHDHVVCANENLGVDFSAEMVVITDDVPAGASADAALEEVRLVMLSNATTLRQVAADVQNQPAVAFSPVAVTLDELGDAWDNGTVHLTVQVAWNGRKVGMCDAGTDMTYTFGQLLSHACKTRALRAGTLVSSGTISNAGFEKNGQTEWPKGYSCIAEKRAMETARDGQASTEYMRFADTVRIEAKGKDGQSVFGAIEQELAPLSA